MNSEVKEIRSENRLSRRDFLKILKWGVIDLGLLAIGGTAWSFLIEPHAVKIERVTLKLPRLSPKFSGLRIAQVSDIHMGGWMNAERLQRVIDLVVDQTPDILLLTGDFLLGRTFDAGSEQDLHDMADIFSPITKSVPSYGVLGNHDYWTNPDAIREMLKISGIIELTNSVAAISRGDEVLHICGVDDIWEGDVRLDQVVSNLPANGAAILMAHEPDFADESAATGRFDLQVSGHSHGGQIVLPFLGPPLVPHLSEKYPSGLYQVGNMFQYTNRGVGMAWIPVRFNCPPEITLFTLES